MANPRYIHINVIRGGENLFHKDSIRHIQLSEDSIQINSRSPKLYFLERISRSEFEQIKQALSEHHDFLQIPRGESTSYLNLNELDHFKEYVPSSYVNPNQYICEFRYLNQKDVLRLNFNESIAARVKAHLLEHHK
jgi:hypothetical protein